MTSSEEQFATDLNALLDELLSRFDDLRDSLGEGLSEYETALSNALRALPDWLAIESSEIRSLYLIDDLDNVLLGPRCVAECALDVETFVEEWIGSYEAAVKLDFDDDLVDEYRAKCAEIERALVAMEERARSTAKDVVDTLGDWLDTILEELQNERDSDERALSDLISEGSVEKGRQHRQENADVWEHYRDRAETLTSVWDELERLAFDGSDRSIAGLSLLREVVENADRGLSDLYPALHIEQEPLEVPDRVEAAERATIELDRESVAAPVPPPEVERRTVELERIHETIEQDRPMIETFDATPDENDEGTSESEPTDGDGADPGPENEPGRSGAGPENEPGRSGAGPENEPGRGGAGPENEPGRSGAGPENEPVHEAFWGARKRIQRIRVPRSELGIVWGLPAVFIGVVMIAALAHGTDQPGAENPFERFPWLWVACVIVLAEAAIVPIIRGWRVSDPGDGRRASLVRLEQDEVEIQISLFEDSAKFGPEIVGRGEGKLRRWEQFNPPAIGWVLSFDDVSTHARESNVTRWEDSARDVTELTGESWSIGIEHFWQLCEVLEIER